MQLAMAEAASYIVYGAPRNVSIEYVVPGRDGALVDIRLVWTHKPATRLAEAMWLSFVPTAIPGDTWTMDIMGHPVSPFEVVKGGTKHIHVVQDGVTLTR